VESRSPRGRVIKATTPLPTPNHPSPPVTKAPEQPKVTATGKTAKPQKSDPKTSAAYKPAAGKSKKTAVASVKTTAAKSTTPNLVVPNQSSTSPLEEISDLDHLPLDACAADSSASHIHLLPSHRGSPPAGCSEDHYRLCGRIWQHALGRCKPNPCASPATMRTLCAAGSLNWSIFSTTTVSIFLLSETYLNDGQAFRLANYRRPLSIPNVLKYGQVVV
jgi:hypothetical protein